MDTELAKTLRFAGFYRLISVIVCEDEDLKEEESNIRFITRQ
jgi:hypothetical protein